MWLVEAFRGRATGRRRLGTALFLGAIIVSLLVPARAMQVRLEAVGLVQRAWAWGQLGDPASNEEDLRRALELDPGSTFALFNLGTLLEDTGRVGEAEAAYRGALVRSSYAPAAGNLGRLLHLSGRAEEGVPILRDALRHNPTDRSCWTSLVVSLTVLGDPEAALAEAQTALARGVPLDRR